VPEKLKRAGLMLVSDDRKTLDLSRNARADRDREIGGTIKASGECREIGRPNHHLKAPARKSGLPQHVVLTRRSSGSVMDW